MKTEAEVTQEERKIRGIIGSHDKISCDAKEYLRGAAMALAWVCESGDSPVTRIDLATSFISNATSLTKFSIVRPLNRVSLSAVRT